VKTAFRASLAVTHLDLASRGLIAPASGLAGLIDVNADLVSDGRRITSRGKVHANKFQLVAGGSAARVPVEIDYESDYDLKAQRGVVKQGDVHIGKAIAQLTREYDMGGDPTVVRLKLRYTKDCALNDTCLEAGCSADGERCLQPLIRAGADYEKSCGAEWTRLFADDANRDSSWRVTAASFDLG